MSEGVTRVLWNPLLVDEESDIRLVLLVGLHVFLDGLRGVLMILILMTVGEFTIRTMVSHRDKRDVDVVGPSYCIFMLAYRPEP
jgi:hypothetical protein